MAFSQLISTYLGEGTHAARPATPNVAAGVSAFYYETDSTNTFVWSGSAWVQINGGGGGGGTVPPDFLPPSSLYGWTIPPYWLANIGAVLTSGQINYSRIYVANSGTAASLTIGLGNLGTSLVTAQNWVGLYNASGILLGSADATSQFTGGTTGPVTFTLTSTATGLALTGGNYYYGAVLSNTTTPGTTLTPSLYHTLAGNGPMTNFGQAAASRVAMSQNSQTTLPASVTFSGLTSLREYKWMAIG